MCGIAGVVALNGHDPEPRTAALMRDRIVHRGPDGNGEFDAPGVSLAACRLAIVDLAPRGLMPMSSPDGRFHIVHNGEIYNRPELRSELERSGVVLSTTTDTEVILRLYEREGPRMLDRLDGMFAFAIWDARQRELFAARDRVGEKPFFYSVRNGRLYFASEPKALFAAGIPAEFAAETWNELITFRSTAGTRTPYVGVSSLLPGHWLLAGRDGSRTERWWCFPTDGPAPAKGDFGPLFEASVDRRMVADVRVGTFLSGGLDSSSVTALAAARVGNGLPSFTVRYDGTAIDEGRYSSAVAASIGVDHHEIRISDAERLDLLADAAWHLDEPMTFQASPEILAVSRYASRHVRVVLTGETADELFGGYTRMRLLRYPRLVRMTGSVLRPLRGRLRPASRWHRAATAAGVSRAEWVAASYAGGDPNKFNRRPLEDWAPYRAQVARDALEEYSEPVRQALAYERLTHLPSIIATGDRMTMGAAIEARLPFTDPKLLDFSALARTSDLFDGPHGKQPLREAMSGRLPELVLNRRKQGWTSPYATYLRDIPTLRGWIAQTPNHPIVAESELGRRGASAIVDGFLAGDERLAHDSWMIGRIVLWHQVCIEGRRRPFGSGSS